MNRVLAYLGLGANLGQAQTTLVQAVEQLHQTPGIQVVAGSPFYRSAPVDANGPDYTNAVCAVLTTLSPEALLDRIQSIEQAFGRERPYRNAPRTLDIDILFYGEQAYQSERLCIPHPRLFERAFVLRPLQDLNPDTALLPRDWPALLQAVAGQALQRLPGAGLWTR